MTETIPIYAEPILAAVEAAEGRLAAKKRLLLVAAVECFAEHGYAACSTRMIAARAGVAEATIFRHYPTKKDLLLRIVEPVLDKLILPGIELQRATIHREKTDIRSLLNWVLMNRLNYARLYAPLVRVVLQEMPVNPELRAMVEGKLLPKIRATVSAELDRFLPGGQIGEDAVDRMLRIVISLLVGYFLTRELSAPDTVWDDEREVGVMVDLLVDGLLPRLAGSAQP